MGIVPQAHTVLKSTYRSSCRDAAYKQPGHSGQGLQLQLAHVNPKKV